MNCDGVGDLTRRGELIDKRLAPLWLSRGAMTRAVQAHSLGTLYFVLSSLGTKTSTRRCPELFLLSTIDIRDASSVG